MNIKIKCSIILICIIFTSCQSIPYRKIENRQWEIQYIQADEKQAYEIDDALKIKSKIIKEIFNPNFNTKIKIKIYPDLKVYNRARILLGGAPIYNVNSGCCDGNKILLCSGGNSRIAVHEYTHLAIHSIPTSPKHDSWIDESICYYLADEKFNEISYLKYNYDFKEFNILNYNEEDQNMIRLYYFIGQFLFESYDNKKIINLLKTRSTIEGLNISQENFFGLWCNWVKEHTSK